MKIRNPFRQSKKKFPTKLSDVLLGDLLLVGGLDMNTFTPFEAFCIPHKNEIDGRITAFWTPLSGYNCDVQISEIFILTWKNVYEYI